MQLAAECVAAMRRAKKHKPRTRFNQLLLQELAGTSDQEEQEEDDLEAEQEECDNQDQDEDEDEDDDISDDANNDEQLSNTEITVEAQMQIALEEDKIKIRPPP